jgi:DtxR family Mn-dependent transcriptional regulator
MAAALGNPGVDPHGDPIPTADGDIAEVTGVPLSDVPEGVAVEVRRVDEHDAERLRYLASLGLVPGALVTVTGREPFGGPVMLRTPAGTHALGPSLAGDILCGRPAE